MSIIHGTLSLAIVVTVTLYISGHSISSCRAMTKCSLVETTFLLLVTVSTVG